tara:strand:+ start:8866 stop:9723 length:858 start_codon:yes stop_codon:yes gene_type:complete
MRLHELNTGYFKLDGGAMFGVVPKGIWNKLNPADEKNLCTWAMRCMLIEDGDRLILIDTGIGNKQSEKFYGYYYLQDMLSLESALKAKGFGLDDVTDVFLTHLHFDHVGGAVQYNATKDRLEPVFKNAKYWSNKQHWDWATINPNPREKASFLKENILPIQESGQLHFIEQTPNALLTQSPMPGIEVFFANGHTEAQMIPIIKNGDSKVVFGADLIPSAYHIPQAYVMGYDMRPLQTIEDKNSLFPLIHENNWQVFLEHDPINEFITLDKGEKGYSVKEKGLFNS